MIYNWNPETKILYVTIPRLIPLPQEVTTKVVDEVTELDYRGHTVIGVQINDVSKRWKPNPLVVSELGHFRTNLIFDHVEKMVQNRLVPVQNPFLSRM